MAAPEAHGQSVFEELSTFGAQVDVFLPDGLEVEMFEGKGCLGTLVVFFAIRLDEENEGTDIGFLFPRNCRPPRHISVDQCFSSSCPPSLGSPDGI